MIRTLALFGALAQAIPSLRLDCDFEAFAALCVTDYADDYFIEDDYYYDTYYDDSIRVCDNTTSGVLESRSPTAVAEYCVSDSYAPVLAANCGGSAHDVQAAFNAYAECFWTSTCGSTRVCYSGRTYWDELK